MKKISLLAVLLMLVLVLSVPAFAAETKAPEGTKAPAAFNFAYGIFIPGPGTPIQLTGGDMPGASLGGPKSPAAFNFAYGVFIPGPGTPIQLTGGDMPGASLGGAAGAKPPTAFNFAYGVFIPGPGTPIQLTGGDMPSATPLCK
jgi:hypothetical protein